MSYYAKFRLYLFILALLKQYWMIYSLAHMQYFFFSTLASVSLRNHSLQVHSVLIGQTAEACQWVEQIGESWTYSNMRASGLCILFESSVVCRTVRNMTGGSRESLWEHWERPVSEWTRQTGMRLCILVLFNMDSHHHSNQGTTKTMKKLKMAPLSLM